jgi:hypothetical protein
MTDDLRHFVTQQIVSQQAVPDGAGSPSAAPVGQPSSTVVGSSPSGASSTTVTPASSDSQPIKIVPKGLRSFDAHDADFFRARLSISRSPPWTPTATSTPIIREW